MISASVLQRLYVFCAARHRQLDDSRKGGAAYPHHAKESAARHSPVLACGLPTESFFARVFGFGHQLGMLCFVYGADWWQGDCCQFWGHNAAIRLEPFTAQCRLPVLSGEPPFGGHIICHDQIEAAFMRRAGFDVRFLPEQSGSYEGNPLAAPDFVKRNTRWCRGNLQNLRLIGAPGLTATSRFHLAYMAGKFFTAVVVVVFAVLAALAAAARSPEEPFPATAAIALYAAWFAVYLMPRLIGTLDASIRQAESYGGAGRLIVGAITEIAFTVLLTPISMFEAAYATLAFLSSGSVEWDGQHRDGYRMPWRQVFGAMWRPTLFGVASLRSLQSRRRRRFPGSRRSLPDSCSQCRLRSRRLRPCSAPWRSAGGCVPHRTSSIRRRRSRRFLARLANDRPCSKLYTGCKSASSVKIAA